jgi:Amt family ammonium transporter
MALAQAPAPAPAAADKPAQAPAPAPPSKIDKGDTAWVLTSSALVLMMTAPGLALFYGGMVRQKNALATLMQSFIIMAVISLQWVLWGYSLAFGPDWGGIIGSLDWIGLRGVGQDPFDAYSKTIPHQAFMLFQMMFAIITPALITGAFAERKKFSAFLLFTVLWATVVYDPLAHWVWGARSCTSRRASPPWSAPSCSAGARATATSRCSRTTCP